MPKCANCGRDYKDGQGGGPCLLGIPACWECQGVKPRKAEPMDDILTAADVEAAQRDAAKAGTPNSSFVVRARRTSEQAVEHVRELLRYCEHDESCECDQCRFVRQYDGVVEIPLSAAPEVELRCDRCGKTTRSRIGGYATCAVCAEPTALRLMGVITHDNAMADAQGALTRMMRETHCKVSRIIADARAELEEK